MATFSERKERKVFLTDNELLTKARELSDAEKKSTELQVEFKVIKDDFKERIIQQDDIIHRNAQILRDGFEMRPVECSVEYAYGRVKFTDVATGDIIEERDMTEDEQMRMSENRIDAEQIIRQSSAEE